MLALCGSEKVGQPFPLPPTQCQLGFGDHQISSATGRIGAYGRGRDTPRLSQLGGATWVLGPEKARNASGCLNWFNVGQTLAA